MITTRVVAGLVALMSFSTLQAQEVAEEPANPGHLGNESERPNWEAITSGDYTISVDGWNENDVRVMERRTGISGEVVTVEVDENQLVVHFDNYDSRRFPRTDTPNNPLSIAGDSGHWLDGIAMRDGKVRLTFHMCYCSATLTLESIESDAAE